MLRAELEAPSNLDSLPCRHHTACERGCPVSHPRSRSAQRYSAFAAAQLPVRTAVGATASSSRIES